MFIVMPSLEWWPIKAKEAPSPHEVRLTPLDTNPVFQYLRASPSIHGKNDWASSYVMTTPGWYQSCFFLKICQDIVFQYNFFNNLGKKKIHIK